MSLENVEAFYERLATDPDFSTQIQSVKSKEECSQMVQAAGYDFTQKEFEQYTTILLDLNPSDVELRNVDEKELAAVYGGLGLITGKLPQLIKLPITYAYPAYGAVSRISLSW